MQLVVHYHWARLLFEQTTCLVAPQHVYPTILLSLKTPFSRNIHQIVIPTGVNRYVLLFSNILSLFLDPGGGSVAYTPRLV